ncbi:MAG: hypothetical protein AB8I08_10225 [Sandaracinaceae bacterium]
MQTPVQTVRDIAGELLRARERKPGIVDTSESSFRLFADAVPHGVEAVAGSGCGVDLLAGERILASGFLRDTPKGTEHRLAMAITDQRTCLSGWSSISGPMTFNKNRGSIPHAALTGVEVKDSLLSGQKVTMKGAGQKIVLTFGESTQPLGAFYRAIGQIPATSRVPPPTPFLQPCASDPSGARGATEQLWTDDAMSRELLSMVVGHVEEGRMDAATGLDFAGRVLLAHRASLSGPGMVEGRWISPMSARDFGGTLVQMFGPPAAHEKPQPDVDMVDFKIDPRRDVVGGALTALGVASSVAIGVGISPGKAIARAMMRKSPVTDLRFMFADQPGFTSFRLFGRGVPLEEADARLAHRLHLALAAASLTALHRRATIGWGPELWG